MARDINVEEAASWSDEETEANLYYLELRCQWADMNRINELRGTTAAVPSDAPFNLDWSAKEVAEWVGEDKERAARALELEQQRPEPRAALSRKLEGLVQS